MSLGPLLQAASIFRKADTGRVSKVLYGSDAMKDYTLPFVPLTLQEIAEEKIALSGAVETASDEEADYYLFIHCGTDRTENYRPVAHRVKTLMKENPWPSLIYPCILRAVSACFLPFVKEEVPIGRLLAYSGWNTASNAIGTAVAQGNIVSMRAHDLPQNELPVFMPRISPSMRPASWMTGPTKSYSAPHGGPCGSKWVTRGPCFGEKSRRRPRLSGKGTLLL